ncbi:hypothetical protein BDDG_13471, partial [Blastomyces dermatitidis ATCC 18188]
VLQLCNLSLIQLVSYVHSHKETFTILHHLFTNFSHSSIIIFIITIIEHHHLIQDFYLFFCSTLFICLSITLYVFLAMALHSHNKHHHSAHTGQFISKSSHIDRFMSADDSELSVESLIKNLKNMIMKKLSVSCVTESLISLPVISVSFSAAFSQSSTPASMSGSSLTTPVPATLTSATSGFTVSAFITSSSHFKKMLCRLNELSLSHLLFNFVMQIKDICVFKNRNMNIVLFYICRHEAFALASEIILIEDDNITETIFSHSQTSLITFSSFSAEKVVHIS